MAKGPGHYPPKHITVDMSSPSMQEVSKILHSVHWEHGLNKTTTVTAILRKFVTCPEVVLHALVDAPDMPSYDDVKKKVECANEAVNEYQSRMTDIELERQRLQARLEELEAKRLVDREGA